MNASVVKQIFILLVSFFMSHNICYGTITESLAFPAEEMTLTTDTIDGVIYCNVSYYDTFNNGLTAHPSLPVKYYTFSIPYNATNVKVSADVLDTNLITTPAVIYPMQEPQPADETEIVTFTLPDSSIYASYAYYPSQIAEVADEGYILGDNHVVTIAVFPLQYNPVAGIIKVNNEINLNVSYSLVEESALPMKILSRNDLELKTQEISKIKSIVYNPTSVEDFAAPLATQITPYTAEALPMYQYCIITSQELAPAFERLVAFKKCKGYDAGIVTMEDIITCENYQNGDTLSGINDNAGKLRAFLADAFQNGTEFVLLGGKETHVPIRYGYDSIPEEKNYSKTLNYIPTDLYFSELNKNWNSNHNDKYGERRDRISYYPDLFVGRLLCENIEEVNNYIDKLLIYELNPGNGDYDYLQRSFILDADELEEEGHANYIAIESQSIFPNSTVKHGSTDYSSGSDIISELNSTYYGYISLHGHGNPGAIDLTEGSAGVGAIDDDHTSDWFVTKESGNAFDCLTNKYYPAICYSVSCVTMPFDNFIDNDVTYNVSMNLGESFTLGKGYGGPAYLGFTRNAWLGIACSVRLESIFLKKLKDDNLKLYPYKIGAIEAFSKTKQFSGNLAFSTSHYNVLSHNLLGDPEFEVWTDVPVKYTDADIDIYRDESTIAVSGSCLEGCKIVVLNTNGDILTGIGKKAGSTSFTVSPNSHVIIYRHNMIPYIAPLCIQNETINNPLYFFANTVSIGLVADGNREGGAVSFGSNAKCVFEAMGDVYLGPNLTLNAGANLTIRTKGKITIDGCTIKSGATISLEGQSVEVVSNVNAEENSVFEYKLL